jgi:hypothetical protein
MEATQVVKNFGKEGQKRERVLVLHIKTEFYEAVAKWKKIYGIWSCIEAMKEVRWMKGMSKERAQLELLKLGATWEWKDSLTTAEAGDRVKSSN